MVQARWREQRYISMMEAALAEVIDFYNDGGEAGHRDFVIQPPGLKIDEETA